MNKLIAAIVALGLGWGVALAQEAPKAEAAKPAEMAKPEAAAPEAPKPQGPKYGKNVGDLAKPAAIKTFEGADFDTGSIAKRSMFVFANSACGMCARELADLDKNFDKLGGLDVYLVVIDQTKERAMEKFSQYQKNFKLLHDPDFKFGENVDFYQTPATLVLEKGGKIVFKGAGYRPDGLKAIVEAAKAL